MIKKTRPHKRIDEKRRQKKEGEDKEKKNETADAQLADLRAIASFL